MTKKTKNELRHIACNGAMLAGSIGLMTRAAKCVFGEEAVRHGVRSGKVMLVLMDSGLSAASLDSAEDMCAYYELPYIIIKPPGALGDACGRANKLAGVTDSGFAKKLLRPEIISGGVTLEQTENS